MGIVEYLCTFVLMANIFSTSCDIAEGEKVVAMPTPGTVDAQAYAKIPSRCFEYRKEVELYLDHRWSRKYTALIMSQMLQESACVANAKSPVGASGLMQIMPTTAQDIADRIARGFSRFT